VSNWDFFPTVRDDKIVAVTLSLLLMSGVVAVVQPAIATSQPDALLVKSLLQSVPANGGTYKVLIISLQTTASQPLIATSTFSVLLSSSNVGVGTVVGSVLFPAGKTFVLANVTTTSTAGSTTITASAQGFQPGSTSVQTQKMGGSPTGIEVFTAPSRTVAQQNYTGQIIVELVDARGNPAQAPTDTPISLSSSSTMVATTGGPTIIVPQGSALVSANYTTGFAPGTATIAASAPGLLGGSATVAVLGSIPTQLRALASTNPAPRDSGQILAVWLVDQSGNPTEAPSNIQLSISNSNTTEVTAPSEATIPAGQSYIDLPLETHSATGLAAKLTISAFNLSSTYIEMGVQTPSIQPGQLSLKLNFAPQSLIADNGTFSAVFVNLLQNGRPAIAPQDTMIQLASNDLGVVGINNSVKMVFGSSWALARVWTSYHVGTAQITATGTNLVSDEAPINAFGEAPSILNVAVTPGTLPATGGTFQALTVGLEGANGQPAETPYNATFNVVSSNPSVLPMNTTVTIPEGRSSVLVGLTTTASPGQTSITVSGQGYSPARASLDTVVPGPSVLKLSLSPQTDIQTPLSPAGMLGVQLLDTNGDPVQTTQSLNVTVTASNSTVVGTSITASFSPGTDFEVIPLAVSQGGTTQLTATSPGLLPSSASATFLNYPLVTEIFGSASQVLVNSTARITVNATVQGIPLQGANVTWSTNLGFLSPPASMTEANGTTSTDFLSHTAGPATVVGTLRINGLAPINMTYNLDALTSFPTTGGSGGGFLGINLQTLVLAVAVAVVVLLAVVFVFGYYRKK